MSQENKEKKLLIVRLSSLGDCVFNIPMANLFKKNGYRVDWIVSEKGYDIIKDNPCVDKVYLAPVGRWKKRGLVSFRSFFEYLKILHEIRKEKYDIAIDTQGMLKTMYWMRFCGAKRRIVPIDVREHATLGGNEIIPAIHHGIERHSVINYMDFTKYLGIDSEEIKFTLPPATEEIKAKIDDLLKPLDKSKPMVVIAPATTRFLKHWSPDNWKEVVENIKDKCSLVFTGTEKDKELLAYIGSDCGLNLAGKTNLKELQELLTRASLVMAPDSGTAHLAWASNNPAVISIFTCTPPTLFGCFGNPDKYFAVNAKLDCQPCFLFDCPKEGDAKNLCTRRPTAQEIINIVNKVLQNTKNVV